MATHTCYAAGCTVQVPTALLMCARHWKRVPPNIRSEVYRWYRIRESDRGRVVGKERSLDTFRHYMRAIDAAREAVREPAQVLEN